MSNSEINAHEWQETTERDGRAQRQCSRCLILDYRIGPRWRVQWPCIVPQESWTLEETRAALVASSMKLGYANLLAVKEKDGKHYAGLLVPDADKYGLTLHPAKSTGTLYPGKALALFFRWAQSLGFDLDTDLILQQRLTSKTES